MITHILMQPDLGKRDSWVVPKYNPDGWLSMLANEDPRSLGVDLPERATVHMIRRQGWDRDFYFAGPFHNGLLVVDDPQLPFLLLDAAIRSMLPGGT